MNLKYFFSLLKKYKLIIAIVILLLLLFNIFNNVKEGYTSCTQLKNCKDCVNAKINDTSSPCYWSNIDKECISFPKVGYSRTCDTTPTPNPPTPTPPTPNPNPPTPKPCPVCPTCPKLTKLKNPTYITPQ